MTLETCIPITGQEASVQLESISCVHMGETEYISFQNSLSGIFSFYKKQRGGSNSESLDPHCIHYADIMSLCAVLYMCNFWMRGQISNDGILNMMQYTNWINLSTTLGEGGTSI